VRRVVQLAAEKIFGWKLPKLTALVFEVSGQRSPQLTEKTFAFLRLKKLNLDGDEIYTALSVEPHMVKHHVPCADILEEERFVFT
jgi:hypothetical protein